MFFLKKFKKKTLFRLVKCQQRLCGKENIFRAKFSRKTFRVNDVEDDESCSNYPFGRVEQKSRMMMHLRNSFFAFCGKSLKNGPIPASFCLFSAFSHYNFNNTN